MRSSIGLDEIMALAALVVIIYGVYLIYEPLAYILAGSYLLGIALFRAGFVGIKEKKENT